MMTSSPCFQSAGVATRCLAVICRRIDHAQDFLEIAPGGHRIDQHQLDLLVGADDEDVADGLIVGRGAGGGIARSRGRQHVVELGDVEIGVADHRIVRRSTLRLADVLRPFGVLVDGVDGKAHQFDAAFVEFRLQFCERTEFGGADRCEILGMREQQCPAIADPIVELDLAFGGLGLEIRGHGANLQCHSRPLTFKLGIIPRDDYRSRRPSSE